MARPSSFIEAQAECQPDLSNQLNLWIQYLETEKYASIHTVRAYLTDVAHFLAFLTRHHAEQPGLSAVADADIRDFRAWLSRKANEGVVAASRARSLSGVRNFYTWLDRNGVLHNPTAGRLSTPKLPRKLPKAMTIDQVFKILSDSLDKDADWDVLRDRALIALLYGSGLRIAEALSLRVKDIESADGMLCVLGKGKKERMVPLLTPVKRIIQTYQDALIAQGISRKSDQPIFIGKRGGVLNAGVAQRSIREIRHRYGLPDSFTPHALRHSYATHLLAEGMNMREIQELLGHVSLSTTQRYTDVDIEALMRIHKTAHPRS